MVRPIRPTTRPHCYICGALDNLTADHLPPKGFFPPKDAQDLITAPLCASCHRPLTKDDEAMRMWMSAHAAASPTGKWIFKHKVLGSTIPRNPRLLDNLQPFLEPTPFGVIFKVPQSRANPFIRRLTKGLLYSLYPEYDYFADYFVVGYPHPSAKTAATVGKLISTLTLTERGKNTFQVWHGITKDTGSGGAWVYLFYGVVCFVCLHSDKASFEQKFPDGYAEHHSLPNYL